MKSLFLFLAAFLVCIPRAFAEKVWTSYAIGSAIQDIAIFENNLWGATPVGPVRWNLKDMTYEIFNNIPDNRVNCLAVTPQGDMWFGTKGGLFLRKHGTGIFLDMSKGLKCFDIMCRNITALAIARDGTVWVSACIPGEPTLCTVAHFTGYCWETIEECIGSIPKIGIGTNDVVWWMRSDH